MQRENCFYIIFRASHKNKEAQRGHQYSLIGTDARGTHGNLTATSASAATRRSKKRTSRGMNWCCFLQQWRLCDEFIMWHMCLVGISNISMVPVFFWNQKKKMCKKTFLTENVESYELQYNTEPGSVQYCQMESFSFLKWKYWYACRHVFFFFFLSAFEELCISGHRYLHVCVFQWCSPGREAQNSVVCVQVAPAPWGCDFSHTHYTAQSCLHTDSAINPNGG